MGALYNRSADGNQFIRSLLRKTFIVEEMVSSYRGTVPPKDNKFYMFGDTIGGLYVVSMTPGGDRAHDSCEAWFAADGKTRIDRRGCVIEAGTRSCAADFCDPKPIFGKNLCGHSPPALPDAVWTRLTDAAKTLGRGAGVPYRIDLFVSAEGVPVLGEFTPKPMNAHFHCAVPDHPSNGTADPCHFGRLWGRHGSLGGPLLPAPPFIPSWSKAMRNSKRHCALAKEYLSASFVDGPPRSIDRSMPSEKTSLKKKKKKHGEGREQSWRRGRAHAR